jgi:hypothetical protein
VSSVTTVAILESVQHAAFNLSWTENASADSGFMSTSSGCTQYPHVYTTSVTSSEVQLLQTRTPLNPEERPWAQCYSNALEPLRRGSGRWAGSSHAVQMDSFSFYSSQRLEQSFLIV